MKFNTIIEGQSLEMEFSDSLNQLSIKPNNEMEIDCVQLSHNSYSLILSGQSHYLTINPLLEGYEVNVDHHTNFQIPLNQFYILQKMVIHLLDHV